MERHIGIPFPHGQGQHPGGQKASSLIEKGRVEILSALGGGWRGGVFTSSATEAHHLATHALQPSQVVLPVGSRLSFVGAANRLIQKGASLVQHPLSRTGHLEGINLSQCKEGDLVFVESASGETGAVQDIHQLVEEGKKRGVNLLVDLSVGWNGIPPRGIEGVRWVSLSFYRFGGPVGIGFLAWRGAEPLPIMGGGIGEGGIRPGRLGVPLVVGAAESILGGECSPSFLALMGIFRKGVEEWEGVHLFEGGERLESVVAGWGENVDMEAFRAGCAFEGIWMGSESACQSGAGLPSKVLQSMGVPQPRAGFHFSPPFDWTKEEMEWTLDSLERCWVRARR